MSIFSSSVKSQIIDPVFHSENRCEFRLANRGEAYLPTLRLGNIGLPKTLAITTLIILVLVPHLLSLVLD